MEFLIDVILVLLVVCGAFFFMVSTVGLIRMPDAFCRMHATTKSDTLGAGLILLALAIHHGFSIVSVKLFLVIAFVWLTNPTAAHIIAKAKYNQK